MNKIAKFDKTNLPQVRAALAAAFAQIEKDMGIKIEIGGITFNETTFNSKLTAIVAESVSDPYLEGVPAAYIQNFNKYREFTGCLLRRITIRDKKYVVVGINGRSKFVIVPEGAPGTGMQVIKFETGDKIYCQVVDKPYNAEMDFSKMHNRFKF